MWFCHQWMPTHWATQHRCSPGAGSRGVPRAALSLRCFVSQICHTCRTSGEDPAALQTCPCHDGVSWGDSDTML